MIYILTEDQTSGYKFWKLLTRISKRPDNYKVYPLNGYPQLIKYVHWKAGNAIQSYPTAWNEFELVSPSKIIISFDMSCGERSLTIAGNTNPVITILDEDARSLSTLYNCPVYRSTYFCIEEAILSFSKFCNWVHTEQNIKSGQIDTLSAYKAFTIFHQWKIYDNPIPSSSLSFYNKDIRSCHPKIQRFYYNRKQMVNDSWLRDWSAWEERANREVEARIANGELSPEEREIELSILRQNRIDMMDTNNNIFSTAEQALSDLLAYLTADLGFSFKKHDSSKKYLGKCWTQNCCPIACRRKGAECQTNTLSDMERKQYPELAEYCNSDNKLATLNQSMKYKLVTWIRESDLNKSFIKVNETTQQKYSALDFLEIDITDIITDQLPPEQSPSTTQPQEPQPPQSTATVPGGQASPNETPDGMIAQRPQTADASNSMLNEEYSTLKIQEETSTLWLESALDKSCSTQLHPCDSIFIEYGNSPVKAIVAIENKSWVLKVDDGPTRSIKNGMRARIDPPDQ